MRFNLFIPVEVYVEEGVLDSDGEPLAKPQGTHDIRLDIEAGSVKEAMKQVSKSLQTAILAFKPSFAKTTRDIQGK